MGSMVVICALLSYVMGILTGVVFRKRCLHDWEPVVERELPSRAEELKKAGENIAAWRDTEDLANIASKKFFAIISCKKCGAVKDFMTET